MILQMSNLTCDAVGTLYNFSTVVNPCVCRSGYYYKDCSKYDAAIIVSAAITKYVHLLVFAISLMWSICKIAYTLYKNKKNKKKGNVVNMSNVSLVMILLANIILATYLWLSKEALNLTEQTSYVLLIYSIMLVYTPSVLLIAATSLATGFWYELFTRKITKIGSTKSKYVVIIGSTIMSVLASIGIITTILNSSLVIVGIVLVFVPVLVMIIVVLVISVMLYRVPTGDALSHIVSKKMWTAKIMLTICSFWLICMIALFTGLQSDQHYLYILSAAFYLSECVIILLLMAASDYHFESIKWAVRIKAFKESHEPSSTTL
jgi:hypothetical protein